MDPILDAKQAALIANNVNVNTATIGTIKSFITGRRTFLLGLLAAATPAFSVTGTNNFTVTSNLLVITGVGSVAIQNISVNSQQMGGARQESTAIRAEAFVEEASRWTPSESVAVANGAPSAAECSWSTTTPTCARTSPAYSRRTMRSTPRPTARKRSARSRHFAPIS